MDANVSKMTAHALRGAEPAGAALVFGVVARVEGPFVIVRVGAEHLSARRATSCLVAPEIDDAVLVARAEAGPAYILAIVDREEGVTKIEATGDLTLVAPEGRVSVTGRDGVDLVTPGKIEAIASELTLRATRTTWAGEVLTLAGAVGEASFGSIRTVTEKLESVAERVVQRFTRVYRDVRESENVRAETLDYSARETMKLRSKNAVVTAESLVKVDGDQIHLG